MARAPPFFAILAAQRAFGGVEIDAGQPAVAHDLLAGDEQLSDMRCVRAREDKVDRLDRHDRVPVKRVEIEHENVGGFADAQRAGRRARRWRIGRCSTIILSQARVQPRSRSPSRHEESGRAASRAEFVVLVESGGVNAERDATAAPYRFGNRRDPASQMQIRAGLVAMTAPEAAIASSSSGRA